jgi:quaternary ammonium compound-resistance protein SugE
MAIALSHATAWIVLIVAGLTEIVWAIGMKYSEGFTKLGPSIITFAAAGVSFWLLAAAAKVLPIGTAYAVWTGIGAVGAAVFGMILFKEPATVARIVCIVLIVGGIAGLKILGPDANA